jgi:hypothetical protein
MADTGVSGMLTDGSGIGTFNGGKILKDAILDLLLSLPPAFAAISIGNLQSATVAPALVAFALGDVLVRVVYRAALKWAETP